MGQFSSVLPLRTVANWSSSIYCQLHSTCASIISGNDEYYLSSYQDRQLHYIYAPFPVLVYHGHPPPPPPNPCWPGVENVLITRVTCVMECRHHGIRASWNHGITGITGITVITASPTSPALRNHGITASPRKACLFRMFSGREAAKACSLLMFYRKESG